MTSHDERFEGASVRRERHGSVEIITIDRSSKHNAVDPPSARAISAMLDEAEADDAVRTVILTATGDTFCAGVDLKHHAVSGVDDFMVDGKGFAGVTERYFPKPLICAVNGHAYGGGYELVLACDLVVAMRTATFNLPEASLGLLADGGALIRLPNRVPIQVVLEMVICGAPLTAERAFELGIVNRLVDSHDQLIEESLGLARQIERCSMTSVILSKRLAYRALAEHESKMWPLNNAFSEAVSESSDYWEGPLAWVEKRMPEYFEKAQAEVLAETIEVVD